MTESSSMYRSSGPAVQQVARDVVEPEALTEISVAGRDHRTKAHFAGGNVFLSFGDLVERVGFGHYFDFSGCKRFVTLLCKYLRSFCWLPRMRIRRMIKSPGCRAKLRRTISFRDESAVAFRRRRRSFRQR